MLKAVHYNEQLLEWIGNEKEVDWNAFIINAGDNTYCFKTDDMSWSGPIVLDKNNCMSTLGGMYRRYAVFNTSPSLDQVEVTVYTEWQEGGNNFSTKLETLFTVWEN